MTPPAPQGALRHGWDGEVDVPFLGTVDGVPVAFGTLSASEYDNLHLAWLGVVVHSRAAAARPRHRDARAPAGRDRGRRPDQRRHRRAGTTRRPAGSPARHGFEAKSVGVQRHQRLADVDWALVERLHAEALAAAAPYELVRRDRPHPGRGARAARRADRGHQRRADRRPRHRGRGLPARADPRLRGRPARAGASGCTACWRGTARPASSPGHSVVTVDEEDPTLGDQHDTAVARQPPRPPARTAAQDRDEPLAARSRAAARGRLHLERRVQRPHDRRQRADRLPARRPRAGAPALARVAQNAAE